MMTYSGITANSQVTERFTTNKVNKNLMSKILRVQQRLIGL